MSSENEQVRKNLVFNILSLLANVGVGVFYTPYLVDSLGIIAYGIVPLALIINQYISVVTGSLTSALTRFYSIALQQNDKENASKYLSTSLLLMLGIVGILILPLWYFVENINIIFTIPNDLVDSSKWLFAFTIFSFYCSLFSSVFNITLYAFNRLDLLNIVKIIRVSGKLIFVFLLFTFLEVNIAYVGLANLATEILLLLYSIYVFYKFSKDKVNLKLNSFCITALKALAIMSFWVIIHQLGDTGLYRIDTVLVNMFWSSKESGILGAFTELGNYTIIIASVIGSLFGPLILNAYSQNDHELVKQITLDRSLSVGVLVGVLVGIIAGFSPIILKIWLNDTFVPYTNWLILKLLLIPFYAAAGVFAFAYRAWNKVRFPAVMTVILGGINFGLLYLLANFSDKNVEYINWMLLIGLVFGIAQSYFLNALYFAKLYEGTKKVVMINFLKILVVVLFSTFVGYVFNPLIIGWNSVLVLIAIAIIGFVLLLVSLFVALTRVQRIDIIKLVYKK